MRLEGDPRSDLFASVEKVADRIRAGEALLILSSGTTGKPKEWQLNSGRIVESKKGRGSREDRWLLTYEPIRWAGISVISHCLKFDSTLIIPTSFSPEDLLSAGIEYQATHCSLTPSLFRKWVIYCKLDLLRQVPLRQVTFGGERADQAVLDLARSIWPAGRITHIYGSAEFGDICAVSDGREGFPIKLFSTFTFSETGELIIGGKGTGDFWELREGRYLFAGRKEEIINVGGDKILAREVEDAAFSCGAVSFARAYALSNPITGFSVALDYVGEISVSEIRERIRAQLPRHGWPVRIRKQDEVELSAAGKTIRREHA